MAFRNIYSFYFISFCFIFYFIYLILLLLLSPSFWHSVSNDILLYHYVVLFIEVIEIWGNCKPVRAGLTKICIFKICMQSSTYDSSLNDGSKIQQTVLILMTISPSLGHMIRIRALENKLAFMTSCRVLWFTHDHDLKPFFGWFLAKNKKQNHWGSWICLMAMWFA